MDHMFCARYAVDFLHLMPLLIRRANDLRHQTHVRGCQKKTRPDVDHSRDTSRVADRIIQFYLHLPP